MRYLKIVPVIGASTPVVFHIVCSEHWSYHLSNYSFRSCGSDRESRVGGCEKCDCCAGVSRPLLSSHDLAVALLAADGESSFLLQPQRLVGNLL